MKFISQHIRRILPLLLFVIILTGCTLSNVSSSGEVTSVLNSTGVMLEENGMPAVEMGEHAPAPGLVLPASVERVVDGDTLIVHVGGQRERVRMIGINTPESVKETKERNTPEGVLASDFSKLKLSDKDIYLEFDEAVRDQYDRLLAYVWLEDGSMFNRTLLQQGYAELMTVPPNTKYQAVFEEDLAEGEIAKQPR